MPYYSKLFCGFDTKGAITQAIIQRQTLSVPFSDRMEGRVNAASAFNPHFSRLTRSYRIKQGLSSV